MLVLVLVRVPVIVRIPMLIHMLAASAASACGVRRLAWSGGEPRFSADRYAAADAGTYTDTLY